MNYLLQLYTTPKKLRSYFVPTAAAAAFVINVEFPHLLEATVRQCWATMLNRWSLQAQFTQCEEQPPDFDPTRLYNHQV